ncbi:hypothetical protein JCM8097_002648 [Rhodosporidiobolus ruineniae]
MSTSFAPPPLPRSVTPRTAYAVDEANYHGLADSPYAPSTGFSAPPRSSNLVYTLPAASSSSSASSSAVAGPSSGNYHYASHPINDYSSALSTPPAPHRPTYSTFSIPPPHPTGMSSTSSIVEAELEYDQMQRAASIDGSASPDAAYYTVDEHGYAYPAVADASQTSPYLDAVPGSGASTPSFQCSMCGWTAQFAEHLDYHLNAHDGNCLFQCFRDGCEAAFSEVDDLLAHTQRHNSGSIGSSSAVKRVWQDDNDGELDQWVQTPQQPNKRVCVEPITPMTPSTAYAGSSDVHLPVKPATSAGISRRLSYEDAPSLPQPPPLPRHNSFDGVSSRRTSGYESSVTVPPQEPTEPLVTTFTLPSTPSRAPSTFTLQAPSASPSYIDRFPASRRNHLAPALPITNSAPVDRGRFDPYPLPAPGSASMSVSYSLPQPPEQFQTPPRGRTIHTRRREQQAQYYGEPVEQQQQQQQVYHSHPSVAVEDVDYYPSHAQHSHLQSPVSPAHFPQAPALIPVPGSSSSRRSSLSSSSHTPSQAALLSAASMNRLLARLPPPTPSSSSQPPSPLSSYSTSPSSASASSNMRAIHPRYREPAPVSPASINYQKKEGEKVHVCSEDGCGRRFKRLEHLKRHERTHTLEKPYQCDVPGCERYFSRSDNLQQHKKTHEKLNGKTARAMAHAAAAKAAAQAAAQQAAQCVVLGANGGER